jgi:hypothetical protein
MRFLGGIGIAVLLATGLTMVSNVTTVAPAAAALSGSTFNAGDIIDDSVFYNASTMSQPAIETFLQQQETNCAPSPGNPGCLKNFVASTPARAANAECAALPTETNQLASQIIFDVSQACQINPQVIIVTLQKEEGLVTSSDPSLPGYNSAMGYACPDTSPSCVGAYAGFATQVYDAAWQFQYYKAFPTHFNYVAGRNNTIAFVPASNTTCPAAQRSSVVYIQNEATAGLYDYTPYQPDSYALANLTGSNNHGCSSYGNRNFWVYFSNWFGSPTVSAGDASFVQALYKDVLNRAPSDAEIDGWGQILMGGTGPVAVAAGFVNSDEYRLIRINAAYTNILKRSASSQEAQGWLADMKQGILQTDDVDKFFYASPEYYNDSATAPNAATDETYVNELYEALIGRPATAEEQTGWGALDASNGNGYVVNAIWSSRETALSRVSIMYQAYLGRTPDPSEIDGWATIAIQQGDAQVRWDIIGSQEYWNDASVRFPLPVD